MFILKNKSYCFIFLFSQVTTQFKQVDVNKFVISIENAHLIQHIVVFLIGTIPFQQGYGASVHLHWPGLLSDNWRFLGIISNEKPSAIFKLTNPTQIKGIDSPMTVEIGLSIELISVLE